MSLDKLTQRAKAVLLSLPKSKKIALKELVTSINTTGGMGATLLTTLEPIKLKPTVQIDVNAMLKEAFYQAIKLECTYVGTEHLLLAGLYLANSKDYDKFKLELVKLNLFPNAIKSLEKNRRTPILDSYSENLSQKLYKDTEKPLMNREEYNNLVSVLLLNNHSNALLVGEQGVGKRTVIDLLAKNIGMLNVPPLLAGYQVIELDLVAFMTGFLNKGNADLGLVTLVEELKTLGRVILSLKNFQNVFFATNIGFTAPIFYSMLKNALEGANIRVIATMNPSLYEKVASENDHLLDNFTVIEVYEPKEEHILNMLESNAKYLSRFHNVEISQAIVDYVYMQAKDEIKDLKFPQKGLDLLDQACAHLIMKKSKLPKNYKSLVDKTITLAQKMNDSLEEGKFNEAIKSRNQIKRNEKTMQKQESRIFSGKKLKLTINEVNEALEDMGLGTKDLSRRDKNLSNLTLLDAKIKKRIIGQDYAVETVVKSLIRSRLGLRSKKRPLGNFLFLGPTGVGKTELAKILSEEAFGTPLIRLDMSDFAEKHNVARLVGAPPGYIGYGEGGELTQKIYAHPDSVVLFDEIEKAHPDVLNILLQIMEEGELSDAKGNTFDFSKSVVILTSNLGTELIHNTEIGFDEKVLNDSKVEDRLRTNLKKILKPELLNRFDEVIVFRKLNMDDQMHILNLLLQDVSTTLKKQNVDIKINTDAKKYLLGKGYSDEYGARVMRRTIEKELLDKIAEALLTIKTRPLHLKAVVQNGSIVIASTKL